MNWAEVLTWVGGPAGILALAWAAVRWWLQDDFLSRKDFVGWGKRVEIIEVGLSSQDTLLSELTRRVDRIEQEQRYQWERIAEHVIRPLERMTTTIEEISKRLERHDAHAQFVEKRLDGIDRKLSGK